MLFTKQSCFVRPTNQACRDGAAWWLTNQDLARAYLVNQGVDTVPALFLDGAVADSDLRLCNFAEKMPDQP